jgi:hypothetical protein
MMAGNSLAQTNSRPELEHRKVRLHFRSRYNRSGDYILGKMRVEPEQPAAGLQVENLEQLSVARLGQTPRAPRQALPELDSEREPLEHSIAQVVAVGDWGGAPLKILR